MALALVLSIERVKVVSFDPAGHLQRLLHHRPSPCLIDLDVPLDALLVAIESEDFGREPVGAVGFLRGSESCVVLGVKEELEEVAGRVV
jgi:hypothetical protein